MPYNLLKIYNQLLELSAYTPSQRTISLKRIFDRDISNNTGFSFRNKKINPTPAEGEDTMERLFRHLTTMITDKATNKREFDMSRSVRLHWIKYHIEEKKKDGVRTYIYDQDELYVIVLEPMRKKDEYFLLTAYHLEGKDKARDKMKRKYERRLKNTL